MPISSVPDAAAEPFLLQDGIHIPVRRIQHREEEYTSDGFDVLRRMQQRHFWYRGRHRFLLSEVKRQWQDFEDRTPPRMIDLGGGCGGWLSYLLPRLPPAFAEAALADSSLKALQYAGEYLPAGISRYQVDLLDLPWTVRWEVVFLLDVLEHIPDHRAALSAIRQALVPGGLLFITTPAIHEFWSWNDDVVHHQRRYTKAEFRELAGTCGYELLSVRYFMFFLSPLLLMSRWLRRPNVRAMTPRQIQALLASTHRVPNPLVNAALGMVFASETPLGHFVPLPWGTSVMAVMRTRNR